MVEYILCFGVVASQAPSGVRSGGGVIRQRLLGHGQLGGRMGRHHSGTVEAQVLCLYRIGVVLSAGSELRVVFCVGGVSGAAAVRSVLPHVRRLPAAGGEGVAVVRPPLQPPRRSDAGQPEQRLHARLPAVPRLRAPGKCLGVAWEQMDKS